MKAIMAPVTLLKLAIVLLISTPGWLCACSKMTVDTLVKANLDGYKSIHSFINKGVLIGKLYGKETKAGVYSNFLIVVERQKDAYIVYTVDRTVFSNTNGKENIPITSEHFHGYHVLTLSKSDMDIEPLFENDGKIFKADPITISWDESTRVFKVWLAP